MKTFNLNGSLKAIKDQDSDPSIIKLEGYASTKDVDRDGDVIMPSAWNIAGGLDNFKNNPIILFNHKYDEPIGRAVSFEVDSIGLKIGVEISAAAGKVFDLIKSGILQTFSVGFRIKDAEFREETMGFLITDAELYEVSVVSVPANQAATFSVSKSFDDSKEFEAFKTTITKERVDLADQSLSGDSDVSQEVSKNIPQESKKMTEEEMKALIAGLAKSNQAERAAERAADKAETIKAAADEAAAKAAAEKESNTAKSIITQTMSGAEQLISDLTAKLDEKDANMAEVIAGLRTEIGEKAAEMNQIHASKRLFDDRNGSNSDWQKEFGAEVDAAHILGIATNKGMAGTKFGQELAQKVNTWSGVEVSSDNYEQLVSTNIERDIQLELILAPMFREVAMTSASMIFPVMPDSGYAEWTALQPPGGSAPHGSVAERGDTYGSPYGGANLTERTVSTKKLMSMSFLANETEEDAIMPILPLIRENMVRSHARTMENMILAGNHADGAFGVGGASPDGLLSIADTAGQQTDQGASGFAAGDKIVAVDLLAMRRKMGKYAVRPDDIMYVVSLDVYYDLLEDPEFQDINIVGSLATKITGVVGNIYGSKVMVCPEFASKAAAKFSVVAVNTRNFFIPRLRGFTVESDYEVKAQQRVIVMSQRIGFTDVIQNHITNTPSVWGLQYKLT